MPFLDFLAPPRDRFFKAHDPEAAAALLKPIMAQPLSPEEKRAVYELMALAHRERKQFKEAMALYVAIHDHYQAGYCAMLMGDLQGVQTHWSQVVTERQNHWCRSLFGMIVHRLDCYPTIFQVRNHIESDIANLIAAGRVDFLENLLSYVDFLTQMNLEAPKFAGRALMHAGWLDRAGKFLIKGQKALPNDPEIYFHLGQYGVAQKHYREARLMLNQCLLISPTYTPARELLGQIAGQE